jgi:hypothetical protein
MFYFVQTLSRIKNHYILPIILLSITTIQTCYAMEEKTSNNQIQLAFCCNDNVVLVTNGEKWASYNITTETRLKQKNESIFHFDQNDDISITIYGSQRNSLSIVDVQQEKDGWIIHNITPVSTAVTLHKNSVFCFYENICTCYDYRDKNINDFYIPHKKSATAFPLISCHPQRAEIIYPYNKTTLAILQPYSEPAIKAYLKTGLTNCTGALYNPNGTIIALNDSYQRYFINNLNENVAYELTTYQKNDLLTVNDDNFQSSNDSDEQNLKKNNYCAAAYHPHYELIALLNNNGSMEYWNYTTRELIGFTAPLFDGAQTPPNPFICSKCLSFSPNGKKLIVAIHNEVIFLNMLHNDLFMIYYLLILHKIPNNIIAHIIFNATDSCSITDFNMRALRNVKKLKKAKGGVDLSKKAEKKTLNKNIIAIYHDHYTLEKIINDTNV